MEIAGWHFLLEHSVAKHVFSAYEVWRGFEGRALSRWDLYHRDRLRTYRVLFLFNLGNLIDGARSRIENNEELPRWMDMESIEAMRRRAGFDWTHKYQFRNFYDWFAVEYDRAEAELARLNPATSEPHQR